MISRISLLLSVCLLLQLSPDRVRAAVVYPSVLCENFYGRLLSAEAGSAGPRVILRADPAHARSFDSINELKIGQYNVENLMNYQGKWELDPKTGKRILTAPPAAKPENRWQQVKNVIERSDDDIMIWEEVEDAAAAKQFIETHLGDKYRVVLIEGNDERGIDVALVVKKDLPFDFEIQSHRALSLPGSTDGARVFSRDLPVITVRKAGDEGEGKPLLRIAGTHFKSQRDSAGDPRSALKRGRQVREAIGIMKSYETQSPDTPIFLIGDFNADIRSAPEFESLWDAGFKDAFDLDPTPVPREKRITQSYFPKGGAAVYSQLDGILVNGAGQKVPIVKDTKIIPYLQKDGKELPLPRNFEERKLQGSDHHKLQVILDFQAIKELWLKAGPG